MSDDHYDGDRHAGVPHPGVVAFNEYRKRKTVADRAVTAVEQLRAELKSTKLKYVYVRVYKGQLHPLRTTKTALREAFVGMLPSARVNACVSQNGESLWLYPRS
jgi:O-phosphoseryl-tRNA(Cys) synthetase